MCGGSTAAITTEMTAENDKLQETPAPARHQSPSKILKHGAKGKKVQYNNKEKGKKYKKMYL